MKKYIGLLALILSLLGACQENNPFCSTYQGTFPAADAGGIDTSLTLYPNGQFTQSFSFIEKEHKPFLDKGQYRLDNDIITLSSSDGKISYYRPKKKHVILLNDQKQETQSELAKFYHLQRTGDCKKHQQ